MPTAAETLSSAPAGGTAPSGGTPNGSTPPLPGANQPAAGWWDSLKDTEVKTWAANKAYPDAESAMKAHWGLERLMGADKAGRTVMLPKDDADADGWKALASKLGVPEKVEDYKLPLGEGQTDDGFAKTASGWFHKAGVPPRAATAIANEWNTWVGEQVKAGQEAEKAESTKQMGALEQEWGPKFTENRELAQRGFREFSKHFGLDDKAALEKAESVLGAANLTKFFHGLGSMNAESSFAGGDNNGGFRLSASDAQAQVAQITADRAAGKISDHQWRTEYEPKMLKLGQVISAQS